MNFQSLTFLGFLALMACIYASVPARARPLVMLVASLIFYASWSVPATALCLIMVTLVYVVAMQIGSATSERAKGRLAATGVLLVLASLFAFKYVPSLLPRAPAPPSTPDLIALWSGVIAPLGISYYSFKLISYLLDVYWEKTRPAPDFITFANAALFFPQIVCGPIQKPAELMPQLYARSQPSIQDAVAGAQRIAFGLFKKLVVAERLSLVVDPIFSQPAKHTGGQAVIACYFFALQLYADFSGLTDIANGVAMLFGIKAPENFDNPYFAKNIQEFWRKWHMTLTSWLTTYVFLPLRSLLRNTGTLGLVVALIVNMMAIAVWHGVKDSYILFGAINALYVVMSALTLNARNRFFSARPSVARWRDVWARLATFHLVVVAFVFFRASSVSSALQLFGQIAHWPESDTLRDAAVPGLTVNSILALFGVVVMEAGHYLRSHNTTVQRFSAQPTWLRWGVSYAFLLAIVLLGVFTKQQFIYAQF